MEEEPEFGRTVLSPDLMQAMPSPEDPANGSDTAVLLILCPAGFCLSLQLL